MNDHEDAVLALLDARCRRAATSLQAAIDVLVAEAPAGELDVIDLPRTARRQRGSRRVWLVAAAVVAVVGLIAALVVWRGQGQEGVVSGAGPAFLLPDWLPDGWDVQEARSLHLSDHPDAANGTVTVYGDGSRDDPWTGPKVSVWRGLGDSVDAGDSAGSEDIVVGGRPATIEEDGASISVRLIKGKDVVLVLGDHMSRSAMVAAADGVVRGDVPSGLADGYEKLASGPVSAAGAFGGFPVDGLSLVYGPSSSDSGELVLVQQPGDRDDAELVRLTPVGVEVTEVRGQPAYAVADVLLQWYEPGAGVVVTIMGDDLDPATIDRIADGLRTARPGEVDELVRAHGSSGPFGRLQPGEVLVAEGESDVGPWRLVASDDGDSLGLTFADTSGSTGTSASKGEDWGTLEVDVAEHDGAAERSSVAVFGAVTPEATDVVVESPGQAPISLEVHPVEGIEGWPGKVFVGVVPADLADARVVARAADGTELAREALDLSSGALGPDSDVGSSSGGSNGDDNATSETCRTLPDGGEECTTSASATAVAPGAGGG